MQQEKMGVFIRVRLEGLLAKGGIFIGGYKHACMLYTSLGLERAERDFVKRWLDPKEEIQ
jgi:hypothetical protein